MRENQTERRNHIINQSNDPDDPYVTLVTRCWKRAIHASEAFEKIKTGWQPSEGEEWGVIWAGVTADALPPADLSYAEWCCWMIEGGFEPWRNQIIEALAYSTDFQMKDK